MSASLLIVDDDPAVVELLVEELREHGYQAEGCTSPEEAIDRACGGGFDLVVSDVEMPRVRGLDLLREISTRRPETLVLLITAFGSIDLAVAALRGGACDFVTKPFPIEVLTHAIDRALRERRLRREIVRLRSDRVARSGEIVAESPAMRRVVEIAERAARTDTNVLLTGESGSGKGTVARLIHARSARSGGPYLQVNCAALPATLAESELFGVRRGAFTDAREDRPGLFAQAHGGTLFLDEVGELSAEVQPKLLQALETGRIRPLGSTRDEAADVRVVAATNRPLEEAMRERRFRPDLYFRLNVIRLEIPPLRDRAEDLQSLVDLFVHQYSERMGRDIVGVAEPALRWLRTWHWPGNVRELANAVERAVALAEHDTLVLEDFVSATDDPGHDDLLEQAAARQLTLEELERAYIQRVLDRANGNKSEAARVLGIDRRTLYRKVE